MEGPWQKLAINPPTSGEAQYAHVWASNTYFAISLFKLLKLLIGYN